MSAHLHAVITPSYSIKDAIVAINEATQRGGESGIAAVIDERQKVVAVITDGDLRKAICANLPLTTPIQNFLTTKFAHVFEDMTRFDQLQYIREQSRKIKNFKDPRWSKVVVCKRDMEFSSFVNLLELNKYGDIALKQTAIYGLGFVGLTLSLILAETGELQVIGVDTNPQILKSLQAGKPHFYEAGLDSLLSYCLSQNLINFQTPENLSEADIHIISVGTPVDHEKHVLYDYLDHATEMIAKKLHPGNLVILRSTVPVGTTQNRVIPKLEMISGLKAGRDFHVAFAPERTVEGNALYELKTLPQIVGGLTSGCTTLAVRFFQRINPTVVRVESLEAAEIVKLVNNTFRDTAFAFSNEVALLCDQFNLDAFDVIASANKGYVRNPIPTPSPGVGGMCLVKDPFLYEIGKNKDIANQGFGSLSRTLNQKMPQYVLEKYKSYLARMPKLTETPKVMLVGLAFKGIPETNDVRFSSSLELCALFKTQGYKIYGWDTLLKEEEVRALEIEPMSLDKAFEEVSGIFFMNNHPNNTKIDVYKALEARRSKPMFFFDGWHMFNRYEIEALEGIVYGTLGYMTASLP